MRLAPRKIGRGLVTIYHSFTQEQRHTITVQKSQRVLLTSTVLCCKKTVLINFRFTGTVSTQLKSIRRRNGSGWVKCKKPKNSENHSDKETWTSTKYFEKKLHRQAGHLHNFCISWRLCNQKKLERQSRVCMGNQLTQHEQILWAC